MISKKTFMEIPKLQEFVSNEIRVLMSINNPNIVKFIEVFKTTNNSYFVYEYCNGGNLE